jgi:hypothetical protein
MNGPGDRKAGIVGRRSEFASEQRKQQGARKHDARELDMNLRLGRSDALLGSGN